MGPLFTALRELRSFRLWMLAVLGLSVAVVFAGVGLMASSGSLISWAALRPPILDMLMVLVAVRFFGISRAVFRYAERLLSHVVTFKILEKMRVEFYCRIMPLIPSRREEFGSGDLLSRFAGDVERLQEVFLRVVSPLLVGLIVMAFSAILLWMIAPLLSVAIVGLFAVNLFGVPWVLRCMNKSSTVDLFNVRGRVHQYLSDFIQGNADILQFGGLEDYRGQGRQLLAQLERLRARQLRAKNVEKFSHVLISNGSIILSLLILVPLVLRGELKGLLLAAVILGILTAFEAFQGSGEIYEHMVESNEAAARLSSLSVNEEPSMSAVNQPLSVKVPDPAQRYSIVFDRVSLAYGQQQVLRDLSFRIDPGQRLYVRGPSGVGKSTIVNLLLKWHAPNEGRIYLGDYPIDELSGENVRKCFSVVTQHTRLFNTTIEGNLLLAKKEATQEELLAVLREVMLEEWVMRLPRGLQSEVGEAGMSVSGGERQRLAIARALLRNTAIWILDEPDASLDGWTARGIRALLDRHLNGKTVLYISHHCFPGRTLYCESLGRMAIVG